MGKSILSCSNVLTEIIQLERNAVTNSQYSSIEKLTDHGRIHKIFHVTEVDNRFEIGNLEEYIKNASF